MRNPTFSAVAHVLENTTGCEKIFHKQNRTISQLDEFFEYLCCHQDSTKTYEWRFAYVRFTIFSDGFPVRMWVWDNNSVVRYDIPKPVK